jgi:hypothetical protein
MAKKPVPATVEGKVEELWVEHQRAIGRAALLTVIGSVLALAGPLAGGYFYKVAADQLSAGTGIAPIGSIIAWPTGLDLPDGWRVCDGREVPFNDKLWDALRGLYDNGNFGKPQNIRLPNFAGCFLRGSGAIDEARASGEIGKRQDDALQQHTHNLTDKPQGRGDGSPPRNTVGFGPESDHESGFVERARVANETRPVNYAVHWIIRVK